MDNREQLLERWLHRAKIAQMAHYDSALRMRRNHSALGLLTVIIPTIVGTSLFVFLGNEIRQTIIIVLGALSLASSTIAALLTFFRFDSQAEYHMAAAAKYGVVRRNIEYALLTREISEPDFEKNIESIVSQFESITTESPVITQTAFEKARRSLLIPTRDKDWSLTKEESIIANLKNFGPLPIEFLAKTIGISKTEAHNIIQSLEESNLVKNQEGKVSLTSGGVK